MDKEKLYSVLNQVERTLRFMKPDVFEEHITKDKKIEFQSYWTKQKVHVTIEIEDIDFEESW